MTNSPTHHTPLPAPPDTQQVWLVGLLLCSIAGAAYWNSFSGPFLYDDVPSITDNPTIRSLWPIGDVLMPPRDSGVTVNGRPIVNLSLAFNYAFGGTTVAGYHAFNLVIHTLAGLTLFGLVRRALLFPSVPARLRSAATGIAATSAAVWLAHPLQTESVTYVIQRAESIVGFFYLLTLYCFARGAASQPGNRWLVGCVVACLLGMGSKEVMASAPVLVLLFDRAFVSGTLAQAWRRHWRLYVALAATWLFLGALVLSTGNRGGTAGFGAGGIPWWAYAFMQCRAIVRYVWLAVWPRELVFDYGIDVERNVLAILPQAVAIVALVGGTVCALVRQPKLGFLGAVFLAVLAPSSSIVSVATETMAEHRMYLPLAAIVVGLGAACAVVLPRRTMVAASVATLALVGLTNRRNFDYSDELVLWSDTLQKWPKKSRAHNNVGEILFRRDQPEQAAARFYEAVRLLPNYVDAMSNLGNVLTQLERAPEALPHLERALRLKPDHPEAHCNLGNALFELNRDTEAIRAFERAIALRPHYADARNNLSVVLAKHGRLDEARQLCQEALRLKPNYADAHYNLGNALAEGGRTAEAIAHYGEALRIKPDFPEVLNNLGKAHFLRHEVAQAITSFERALALRPHFADAHNNYAATLYEANRVTEAIKHFRRAIELRPDYADARKNSEWIQSQIKSAGPGR